MAAECVKCHVCRIVTVTESFLVGKRTVYVTLCMRCWLEERKAKA